LKNYNISTTKTSEILDNNSQFQNTTSISANADGLRDAASRKIDNIALPTKYNYQAMSVG